MVLGKKFHFIHYCTSAKYSHSKGFSFYYFTFSFIRFALPLLSSRIFIRAEIDCNFSEKGKLEILRLPEIEYNMNYKERTISHLTFPK